MLPCPICGEKSVKTIHATAHDYITDKYFQVLGCSDCSIVYTTPQPVDMSSFYPKKYRHYNPVIQKILEILYTKRAKRWSKKVASAGTVFEVGCGNGIMLQVLRKYGWTVFGNERTVEMARFAHLTFNLPIFAGDINSLCPLPFADLIILFQVLEHLENPVQTLQQLNALLKPDGRIIIAVPNFGSWQSKFGGEKWFHLDVPRHLFHFSLPSLEFCLNKSGFKIAEVNYISLEHDPYGWIQSVLNYLYKKHNLLTRFLMGIDRFNMGILIHLTLAVIIGAISLPLSIISWLFNNGAIIEVTAHKANATAI